MRVKKYLKKTMRLLRREERLPWEIVYLIAFGVLLTLIVAGYGFNWAWAGFSSYTSKPGQHHAKTLWDWFQLLGTWLIPIMIALFTINFTKQQSRTEHEISLDNQREAALQAYFDKMSELLLKENLRKSEPNGEVRKIARARTLSILRQLDGKRKASLLQFLYESDLIHKDNCIVDLHDADLSNISLVFADLHNADLSGTKLDDANFMFANLQDADLRDINYQNIPKFMQYHYQQAIFDPPD